MKRLDFIFFDAGGGHRAAANGPPTGDGKPERALRDPHGESPGSCSIRSTSFARSPGFGSKTSTTSCSRRAGRWVRRSSRRHAPGDPPVSRRGRCALLEHFWQREPPGYGRFAGAQFQSRSGRKPAPRAARRASGHHPHRHRGLSRRISGSSARSSTSSAARTRPSSRRSPWATPPRACIAPPA